jgi:hypothetical protein
MRRELRSAQCWPHRTPSSREMKLIPIMAVLLASVMPASARNCRRVAFAAQIS